LIEAVLAAGARPLALQRFVEAAGRVSQGEAAIAP
jgi:hypothetical protein